MKIETKYIASDGQEFQMRHECQNHEDEINQPRRKILEDYIIFYNCAKERMIYSPWREPTFVYVKKIPEYETEARAVWDEVLNEELNGTIESYERLGWYVQDEYERWQSVEKMQEDMNKTLVAVQEIFEKDLK